jgi:hypothetical protein
MFEVEGIVIVDELNAPCMTPITIKPFIFVITAVTTTEVRPETGEEMLRIGVVYIWISVLNTIIFTFAFVLKRGEKYN